nr:MAK10-like protein [Tanacetum cinerariifolium]
MFDEYFKPTTSDVSLTIFTATLSQDTTGATSLKTIDHNAPSPSTTQITDETITPIHDNNVEEKIQENLYVEFDHVSLDVYAKDHVNLATRHAIDHSAGRKLRDKSAEESWELVENLALYDHESWNGPREFAKPVKEISLPQVVLSTSNRRFIELKNQVQRLMEAHLAPKPFVQVNKIASSCEICGGPYDT